jgi:hypothetical protein
VIEELLDRDALAEQMRSLHQAHVPASITPGAPSRFRLDGIWQDLLDSASYRLHVATVAAYARNAVAPCTPLHAWWRFQNVDE